MHVVISAFFKLTDTLSFKLRADTFLNSSVSISYDVYRYTTCFHSKVVFEFSLLLLKFTPLLQNNYLWTLLKLRMESLEPATKMRLVLI